MVLTTIPYMQEDSNPKLNKHTNDKKYNFKKVLTPITFGVFCFGNLTQHWLLVISIESTDSIIGQIQSESGFLYTVKKIDLIPNIYINI